MNLSSLLLITLLPSISKFKFSIEVSVIGVSSINSSFGKRSILISSLIFSLARAVPLEVIQKIINKQYKFSTPNNFNFKNYKLVPSNQKISIIF
jgi:hypothetical protein